MMKYKRLAFIIVLATAWVTALGQVKAVKHFIFIGCDGMGAYAVDKPQNPTMQMMMKNGAYSLKALCAMPSRSAINWASHFMGAGPEQHGYTKWNSKVPEVPSKDVDEFGMFPTIFYALKKQKPSYTSAAAYEWEGIQYLIEKECVDKQIDAKGDVETTAQAIKLIETMKPNLLAIVFNGPDSAGHEIGFSSPAFYEKVKNTDNYIAQIIEATKKAGTFDNTVFLVTADHGGIRKDHGEDTPTERQIPWILYGKPVRKIGEIKKRIMVYDTAPTIAWLFGLKAPKPWIGKTVKCPF